MKEIVESSFTIGDEKASDLVNVFINDAGEVERRKGWNTFSKMVKELWRINKSLKKYGAKSEIRLTLPLKGRALTKKTLSILEVKEQR